MESGGIKKTWMPEIPGEKIQEAINGVFKLLNSKEAHQKPQLIEHDMFFYLVITMKKIPQKARVNPTEIPIPNPVIQFDGTYEFCLIVDDRREAEKNFHAVKDAVKRDALPVSKVLRFSKLLTDYKSFEAKRKLCGSFDVFFADKTIVTMLPKLLGKKFFEKKKHPLRIHAKPDVLRQQIEKFCYSALFYVPSGSCSLVRVGRTSQSVKEIAENVAAVLDNIEWAVPGKWKNIRSLHITSFETLALPIYEALPDMALKIQMPVKSDVKRESVQNLETAADAKLADEYQTKKATGEKASGKSVGKKGRRIRNVRYMDFDITQPDDGNEKEMETELLISKEDNGLQPSGDGSVSVKKTKQLNGKFSGVTTDTGLSKKKRKKDSEVDKDFEVSEDKLAKDNPSELKTDLETSGKKTKLLKDKQSAVKNNTNISKKKRKKDSEAQKDFEVSENKLLKDNLSELKPRKKNKLPQDKQSAAEKDVQASGKKKKLPQDKQSSAEKDVEASGKEKKLHQDKQLAAKADVEAPGKKKKAREEKQSAVKKDTEASDKKSKLPEDSSELSIETRPSKKKAKLKKMK
eukprot:TRINITY_DN9243_c0_g1_i1.p1 TRINITY_DN9243_c0_g1~~TRINITY_DN9243_c0_g1_i1.p1  ORF type:complete len:575 (+),score=154.07 TRINITY_DN9243_c0_g1_i1:211-1935(+)